MTKPIIYLSPPSVDEHDRQMLLDAFDSNWISTVGPNLAQFESAVCELLNVPFAVAVNSGTAAIHLALCAVGVAPGDEVLCSSLTFCASANPVVHQGGKPVFIDSETESWNLDPNLVAEELAERARDNRLPRAIIAVDIFGQCANMDAIAEAAHRYEIPVIEDAAEALGSTYRSRPAGSLGHAGILSFNGNKMITTSGGGMLCSHDATLIDTARHLATQARLPVAHYEHDVVGYNYRMSNLLAALGTSQLSSLPSRVARRRETFRRYHQNLSELPGVSFMPEAPFGSCNRWLTVITVDPAQSGYTPEQLRRALADQRIETRPVWKPLHLQASFTACRFRGGTVAEKIYETGLCLPSGSGMTDAQQERVIEAIMEFSERSYRRNAA